MLTRLRLSTRLNSVAQFLRGTFRKGVRGKQWLLLFIKMGMWLATEGLTRLGARFYRPTAQRKKMPLQIQLVILVRLGLPPPCSLTTGIPILPLKALMSPRHSLLLCLLLKVSPRSVRPKGMGTRALPTPVSIPRRQLAYPAKCDRKPRMCLPKARQTRGLHLRIRTLVLLV